MPTKTVRKGLIGTEDLKVYDGTSTFSRATSTGASQTVTKFPVGAIPVIATASLPAASSAMNGTVIIEDAGTNDVNLILYAKGQRYRLDGGSPF